MNGMQVFMPMVPAQGVAPAQAAVEQDGRTTLMLRNLPKSYTRSQLLRILDDEGFRGSYCFIYVPTDFKSFSGFGYAFVAFHQHEDAVRAKQHFQGYSWGEGEQSCDVAWSGPVQGRQQHVERYRNSPVMHESVPDEYKPAVFENGERMPFPAPTKAIRAPRLRHGIAGAVLGPGAGDK
jgi:RNA recognition motif-containing protein